MSNATEGTAGLVLREELEGHHEIRALARAFDRRVFDAHADHETAVTLLRALMEALVDPETGMSVAEAVGIGIAEISGEPIPDELRKHSSDFFNCRDAASVLRTLTKEGGP